MLCTKNSLVLCLMSLKCITQELLDVQQAKHEVHLIKMGQIYFLSSNTILKHSKFITCRIFQYMSWTSFSFNFSNLCLTDWQNTLTHIITICEVVTVSHDLLYWGNIMVSRWSYPPPAACNINGMYLREQKALNDFLFTFPTHIACLSAPSL